MEIFDSVFVGLGELFTWPLPLLFLLGLINGLIFGLLPGLSGSVGIAPDDPVHLRVHGVRGNRAVRERTERSDVRRIDFCDSPQHAGNLAECGNDARRISVGATRPSWVRDPEFLQPRPQWVRSSEFSF